MLVKDLMTKNVNSCRPENNLAELAKVMRKQRCGALPIVDVSGRVRGIITDRDICIALGMKERQGLGDACARCFTSGVHQLRSRQRCAGRFEDDGQTGSKSLACR